MTDCAPFWETKSLRAARPPRVGVAARDGCGKCCLHKLEDEDTGHVHLTVVACQLLDVATCRCTRYPERKRLVPACVRITPKNARTLALPSSCAYRCLAEGRAPLASAQERRPSERACGGCVGVRPQSERDVDDPDDLEDYVIASSET